MKVRCITDMLDGIKFDEVCEVSHQDNKYYYVIHRNGDVGRYLKHSFVKAPDRTDELEILVKKLAVRIEGLEKTIKNIRYGGDLA